MQTNASDYRHHISQKFNKELEDVRASLIEMGALVEEQVKDSIAALILADEVTAEKVIQKEERINELEILVDEGCMKILALHQPAASDLRLVVSISKVVTDLERIGDEAKKIAKLAKKLISQGGAPKGYKELRLIGEDVLKMLSEALTAFRKLDVEESLSVVREDRDVDEAYQAAIMKLAQYMTKDSDSIHSELHVLWALRALERIGDHASNIVERVIYLVKGKDVRHISLEEMEAQINEE